MGSDKDGVADHNLGCANQIQEWGNGIISGQTKMGKLFVRIRTETALHHSSFPRRSRSCSSATSPRSYSTVSTRNITSECPTHSVSAGQRRVCSRYMESCTAFHTSISMQLDLGLNVVFLVYFILRVPTSIFASLVTAFLFPFASSLLRITSAASGSVCILSSTCSPFHPRSSRSISIGVGSVFAVCVRFPLMNVPDILQYMGVIERPRTIRIVQLASKFIALCFAAAGIVHLVENSGDFFCQYCNGQDIDLFNAVYFMIVTMATVGYGDISCKTYIGKVFVLLCLISGLVSLEQKRSIDSMARFVDCRQRSLQWFQNFRIYSVQRAPTSAGIRGSKANGTGQTRRSVWGCLSLYLIVT